MKVPIYSFDQDEELSNEVYILNLKNLSWSIITLESGEKPKNCGDCSITEVNGTLYLFGGKVSIPTYRNIQKLFILF